MMKRYKLHIVAVLLIVCATFGVMAQDNAVMVWTTFDGAELDWLTAKVDEFNDMQSDVVVEVQSFADDESLMTTYNNNQDTEPALLHLSDDFTQAVMDMQIVQPMGDVVGDAEMLLDVPVYQMEWFDSVKAHASVNNNWMMIPISASTAMNYVNLDLLSELGSSFTFVPQDLTTIEVICEELQSAIEDGTLDGCIAWDDTAWLYEHWLAQQNMPLVNNENARDGRATTFDLQNDASINNVVFMRQLYEAGYASDSFATDVDPIQQFLGGRVPILIADNTVLLDTDMAFEADLLASNVDFGWSGARLDTENLWLSASVDPEIAQAAVAFGMFLMSPENNVAWHQATGSLPLTQTAYDMLSAGDWAETHPEQINAFRALTDSTAESGTLYAIIGNSAEIRNAMRFGLDQIILNDVEITQSLETTEEFVNDELNKYNLTSAPDED